MAATPPKAEPPEEPLAESAPLAWQLASRLCTLGCAAEHGAWQYLRLLGLVASPALHADFYRSALQSLPRRAGGLRVLISGSADYGMLAQVLSSAPDAQVTALDRCATPLEMNRWYAHRLGRAVTTLQSDVLAYGTEERFDAICTHAFLGYFSSAQRPALVAKWRELLAPGGAIVTLHRLRPSATGPTVFSAEELEAYRANALAGARRLGAALPVSPEAFAEAAVTFASRQKMHPLRSPEELSGLLETGGFRIERLDRLVLPPRQRSPFAGAPGTPGQGEYACFIARRR